MIRVILVTYMALVMAGFVACADGSSSCDDDFTYMNIEDGKFTDKRDGNKYAVVLVGGKYWMAENLRYADSSATPNLKGNMWCLKNSKDSCSKYGPLYSWTAALDIDTKYVSETVPQMNFSIQQGICPIGWRIPTSSEWLELRNAFAAYSPIVDVGAGMKSVKGWVKDSLSSVAANRFGFNGMPAGRRNSENGEFMSSGKYAFFWASNEKDLGTSDGWTLRYDNDRLDQGFFYKDHGMSIRCVRDAYEVQVEGSLDSSYMDEIPFDYKKVEYEGKSYKTIRIGSQNWMAENMNRKTDNSWCYNDDSKECEKYGRLYSFEAAKTVCPKGWKLPTPEDFETLVKSVNFGHSLMSREGWTEKGGKGWNLWGFNAKPSGGRESGDFFDSMLSAYFWMTDQQVFWLRYYNDDVEFLPKDDKTAFSVRCIEE